jgi:hypothetical protein
VIEEVRKGHGVLEAGDPVGCHFTVTYDCVHRFNTSESATFEQIPNPKGHPPIPRAAHLRELVVVALSSPAERGFPFCAWSVREFAKYYRGRSCCPR